MKHNRFNQNEIQGPANSPRPASATSKKDAQHKFIPPPDEVARRAYFIYVNGGSQDGHEVQHWLAAEAELIVEANLTRIKGFCNRT